MRVCVVRVVVMMVRMVRGSVARVDVLVYPRPTDGGVRKKVGYSALLDSCGDVALYDSCGIR